MGRARLNKALRKAARLSTKVEREYEVLEDKRHHLTVCNTYSSTRGLYLDMKREAKSLWVPQ